MLLPLAHLGPCMQLWQQAEMSLSSALPVGLSRALKEVDVAHNIGAAANEVVKTLATLRDNATCKDLDELFTRSENTPTPAVSTAQPTTLQPSPTEGP